MIVKFPTTAFLAGRLKEVGWESDCGQCLLTQFREDLMQECGDELSKVLEHFRLVRRNLPRVRSEALFSVSITIS
jgi:hypothetical protein